jgi:hypothetical protein
MSLMMMDDRTRTARSADDDNGWGPMRRMLQICTALITIYAFYHGWSSPHHVFEVTNGPSIGLRILAGIVIAFIPSMIFGLTFVRAWK